MTEKAEAIEFGVGLKPTLISVLYGEPGAGKSWLAASAPPMRLIIDAEGRAKYTPGKKVGWDPMTEPKFPKGTETVVVPMKNFDTVRSVYQWLMTGQHPFTSLTIDSLMETQKKAIEGIAGQSQMTTPMWGELLRKLEGLLRTTRDLVQEESNPLHVATFVCGTTDLSASGVRRPLLQGSLSATLPYIVDVVGFLRAEKEADASGNLTVSRKLLIDAYEGYVTKDNTGALTARHGAVIVEPNLSTMFDEVKAHLNG